MKNLSLLMLALLLFAAGVYVLMRPENPGRNPEPGAPRPGAAAGTALQDTSVADREVDPQIRQLLELGFEGVSGMPDVPHEKNRSRTQMEVCETAFAVGLPRLALKMGVRITNWRRGAVFADFALHSAKGGHRAELVEMLDRARRVLEGMEDDKAARRDRIRQAIARTYLAIGDWEPAERYGAKLEPSVSVDYVRERTSLESIEDFEGVLATLEGLARGGDLDQVRNAVAAAVAIFGRPETEPEQRDRLEGMVRALTDGIPVMEKARALLLFGEESVKRGDPTKAGALARDARELMDSVRWTVEHRVQLLAEIAALYGRAGELAAAKKTADEALAHYDAHPEGIVNMFRAGALVPLAEAYTVMGDDGTASTVYQRACDEALVNVNSRPRSQDLALICRSLALHNVLPDGNLWAKLRGVRKQLGTPW